MKPSFQSRDREKIIADALWPVASELRMIDVADLISMLRFERHADLSDLVATAAELFFLPGIVTLGIGGDYALDWSGEPKIVLDLEIRPAGVTIYVRLTLEHERAGVEISHITFDDPACDAATNTSFLVEALASVVYRPLPGAMVIGAHPGA
ncbi:hypothetical protein [Pseudohoeflea coraliihabitans]|uniref:Uncharacterized protein n=1 Tax=Pseudohoeflea coraliihabitans TaxID=2860393 RepID=A0ABS6WN46_9HYPH|nr:hypothetical protein [Pseudohoeflea sp. DP4N28-3]MBW3097384.1 hypothetical protein [Pseudohoeflea sp. DP4N28-3]